MRSPLLSAFVLCVTIGACDFFSEPTSDFRERARAQLDRREFLWDSLALHDYDFSYLKQCDCPSATESGVKVTVRADTVDAVADDIGTDITGQPGMRWPTVDSLFARARAILADESVTVQILFDSTYHYPIMVESFRQADGELIRHVSGGLVPLTP